MSKRAYEFSCDKTLEEIHAALNELGPYEWIMRDSHWYGDYLSTNPAGSMMIKIYEPTDSAGPPFTIQVEGSSKELPGPEITKLLRRWYEALAAVDIKKTEAYD